MRLDGYGGALRILPRTGPGPVETKSKLAAILASQTSNDSGATDGQVLPSVGALQHGQKPTEDVSPMGWARVSANPSAVELSVGRGCTGVSQRRPLVPISNVILRSRAIDLTSSRISSEGRESRSAPLTGAPSTSLPVAGSRCTL